MQCLCCNQADSPLLPWSCRRLGSRHAAIVQPSLRTARKLLVRSRAQPPALTVLCSGQHIRKLSADLGDIPQVVLQPGAPEPRGRPLPLLLRPLQKLRQGRSKAGRRQAQVGAGSDVLGGATACCTLLRRQPQASDETVLPPPYPACLFSAST